MGDFGFLVSTSRTFLQGPEQPRVCERMPCRAFCIYRIGAQGYTAPEMPGDGLRAMVARCQGTGRGLEA